MAYPTGYATYPNSVSNNLEKTAMKLIYVILFITLVTGCISSKNQLDSNSKHDEVPMSPQLIFINYKATKSKGNLIRIELINKTIVDGNLKKGDSRESISSEMNFKCVQLDENTMVIDSLYILSLIHI